MIRLEELLDEVGQAVEECREEGLPETTQEQEVEMRRLARDVVPLASDHWKAAIYPSRDGDLCLHFKGDGERGALLVAIEPGGGAAMVYDTKAGYRRVATRELPDGVLRTRLGEGTQ